MLNSSKLKQFAEDNFKFDENGRKLSRRVENTVAKGEIAGYEQFLVFPQCFQKDCFSGVSLCGNGLKMFGRESFGVRETKCKVNNFNSVESTVRPKNGR